MTIKDSIYFLYNGESCEDYGVTNISLTNGMQEEPFSLKRAIKETKVRGKNFLNYIESNPIEFPITLWFEDGFDDDKLRNVARWLFQDDYKPLVFSENIDKVYYAVFVGDSKLQHFNKNGSITVTVRCRDEFIYSPEYMSQIYDLRTNVPEGTEIEFVNNGDEDCLPEFWIQKFGNGSISIFNLSDGGKEVKLSNLVDGETIYVNNETRKIVSDLPNTYHYDDLLDRRYLRLVWGHNRLLIKGNCSLWFRYHFKLRA